MDVADMAQTEEQDARDIATARRLQEKIQCGEEPRSDEESYEERLREVEKMIAENSIAETKTEAKLKNIRRDGKAYKKLYERLVDEGPEHRPLLDPTVNKAIAENAAKDDPEWYRDIPVERFGLSKSLTDKLTDGGVRTWGDWEDIHTFSRLPPKGIGTAAAEKIEAAIERLIEEHNKPEHEATVPFGTLPLEDEDESEAARG